MTQKLQPPITVGQTVYRAERPSKYTCLEVEQLFDGRDGKKWAVCALVCTSHPRVLCYSTWNVSDLYHTQEEATEVWEADLRAKLEAELGKVSA